MLTQATASHPHPNPLPQKGERTCIQRILELARWAPSGDNTQPWRFEIIDDHHLAVHAFDTRQTVVYDLQGRASQLAHGILLETIRIAASAQGLGVAYARRGDAPEHTPIYDVRFHEDPSIARDPLVDVIPSRTTQRRPMHPRALVPQEKRALEQALPAALGFAIRWIEGDARRGVARLLFKSAHIRLTTEECYRVHKHVIHWRNRYSDDRMPDQAIGLGTMTLRMMEWAMKSWGRVRTMNRLMGTAMPRLQLDYMPALKCGAHFLLLAERAPQGIDDYVAAGAAVQRFWLTSAKLGLQFQPEMTPLIFANYVWNKVTFVQDAKAQQTARAVAEGLAGLVGQETAQRAMFMGRLGHGAAPRARSLRLPLEHLRKTD
ncbi:MAG: nitroreductase family protein [Phycisphaeraceae bacterium]